MDLGTLVSTLDFAVAGFLANNSGYTPMNPNCLILQMFDFRTSIHTCQFVLKYLRDDHHYRWASSHLLTVYINDW